MALVVSSGDLLRLFIARKRWLPNELITLDGDRSDGSKDVANGLVVVAVDNRKLIAVLTKSDAVHQEHLSDPLTPEVVVDHDGCLGGDDCLPVFNLSKLTLDAG